jgi:hypothetical protein
MSHFTKLLHAQSGLTAPMALMHRRPPVRSALVRLAIALALATSALTALAPVSAAAQPSDPSASTCVIHSLPSFVAQGEGATAATVADVVEVECDPTVYGTGSKIKVIASQLFSRCRERLTWWVPNPFARAEGRGVSVALDADGNATVALLGGPGCEAGESLVSAHMEEAPFETFTTSFTVLPPTTTPPGLFALPATQVEDALSSGFATIVQAEFENGAEKTVRIGSEELYARCRVEPHLHWIGLDRSATDGPEVTGVPLDNDGNGFVIAIGDDSCAPGVSLIEGDLESKPFTTFTTPFTILPPQPTGEPAFEILKSQRIAGSGGDFTSSALTASAGQTVEYQITVVNTGKFAETLSAFTDAHCDPATIAAGPGAAALAVGQSTSYTCSHLLSSAPVYTNEATVTATTVAGSPLTQTSNQVVVEVLPPLTPKFSIEKLQRIAGGAGGFTSANVTGAIGDTVEYEIVVANIGEVALTLSGFSDPRCDQSTLAGGPGTAALTPGSSTTYTCSHVLTSAGSYVNVASVVGNSPSGVAITLGSNEVEATVPEASVGPRTVSGAGGPAPAGGEHSPGKGGSLPSQCAAPAALHGASGLKRAPFTVQISSRGIKQIMFYLDGREIKVLKQSQAARGKFTLSIDPRKLSYGAHKIVVKTFMTDRSCARVSRNGVFVRPGSQQVKPFFTG